ncbi:hypothetical protein GA562_24470 [Bacteroides xylanisolvens]|uniref:Uncharacterized protein n=1 Tax=Bacteroides xylanisolvens TaxID=371601 RepID=A0A4Q5D0H0_9BACE|nr:hypothetical protein GA560_24225 [Bacteroides xylanisolvens]KAB6079777.1 hypothetical protein GA551_22940 [Bacteroides xylanisolvens]KAB6089082.1 hypothetical protein GA562_24470 [Bacteroides xylanisolvens]RYT11767.1 hypothetical protein EAJ13_24500 [Bacteroides xylanisolvens]
MYTINFCPPGELAYVRFILCGRYFDLQPICRRYLQRSNYLSASVLHAFGCRWQMFSCFFNFMVVPQSFK